MTPRPFVFQKAWSQHIAKPFKLRCKVNILHLDGVRLKQYASLWKQSIWSPAKLTSSPDERHNK